MSYILAIDQGTTSTRAIIFTATGSHIAEQQIAFTQHFPHSGWVEHDPQEILTSVISCCQLVIQNSGLQWRDIAAIGITNQRETTIIWDRNSGEAIYPAIVWQDRRTAAACQKFIQQGYESLVYDKTGLLLDPYFSATKIAWILEHVPGAMAKAQAGDLAFGTVDSYLLWHLTKGRRHLTDATNAARTLLFNIHTQSWDADLLNLFAIPDRLLPTVYDTCASFGVTDAAVLGAEIPIVAVAGDQQAALVGQACLQPGMVKSTYGTGCFLMMNTGAKPVKSHHQLLTTVAYRFNNEVTYAVEGSIFSAGSAIKWLREQMGLFKDYAELDRLLKSVSDSDGVYLVPAFTGLGAPYWKPDARGALFGLTRNTKPAHILRAALDAICYQTRDLINALSEDFESISQMEHLRIDGGMAANDYFNQLLANLLGISVARPGFAETTALGVAYLTALQIGLLPSLTAIEELWQAQQVFVPELSDEVRDKYYAGWLDVVKKL